MEEIKLKNKVGKIVTSANELTIGAISRCEKLLADPFKNDLDKNVAIVQELSNLSVEEIEDLPMLTLVEVVNVIGTSDYNMDGCEFSNEFTIDGITFKNRAESEEDITFSVKEIFSLRELFKKESNKQMVTIASVLFREVIEDGTISRDISEEAILRRNSYMDKMTLDIITPYMSKIEKNL